MTMCTCSDCKNEVLEGPPHSVKVAEGFAKKNGEISPDTYRCSPCNKVRSRLTRFFENQQDMKSSWSSLPSSDRVDFIKNSHDLMGAELAKSLTMKISLFKTKTKKAEEILGGEFHPKDFFEDKYKNNPDALANLFANAPTVVHPDTKETMWRDTKVNSSELEVTEEKKEFNMQVQHEGKVKSSKAKAAPKKDGEVDGEPPMKKLKPGDKSKMEALVKQLEEKSAEIDIFCEKINSKGWKCT